MVDRISCRGVILDWDKLLVVNLDPKDNYYCLPWGTLEKYEELESCLKREILEELWVEPKIKKLMYIHEVVIEKKLHLIEFFFAIENIEDYHHINLENATHSFEINELRRINIYDESVIFLPKWLLQKLRKDKKSNITEIITSK